MSTRYRAHRAKILCWVALVRLLTAYGFEIVAAMAGAPEMPGALVEHRPIPRIIDLCLLLPHIATACVRRPRGVAYLESRPA